MPNINVAVPYQIPQEEALSRIQNFVSQIKTQYSSAITDFQESWNGSAGTFSGAGRGFSASGNIVVNPSQVVVDLTVPFAAMFFKGKIESTLREELAKLLS
jgi:hypothetical protein